MTHYERKTNKFRHRRTENFGIIFKNGMADEWVFGVPEAFKLTLDILHYWYVDKKKTEELRRVLEPTNSNGEKRPTAYRSAWSRGSPPVRSFAEGHIFYDPPAVRQMVWSDALKVLRRAVQVCKAEPDIKGGPEGWVRFVINYYDEGGYVARTEEQILSQAEFEWFLRGGD
jgi:hypothetical protein